MEVVDGIQIQLSVTLLWSECEGHIERREASVCQLAHVCQVSYIQSHRAIVEFCIVGVVECQLIHAVASVLAYINLKIFSSLVEVLDGLVFTVLCATLGADIVVQFCFRIFFL